MAESKNTSSTTQIDGAGLADKLLTIANRLNGMHYTLLNMVDEAGSGAGDVIWLMSDLANTMTDEISGIANSLRMEGGAA